MTLVWRPGPSGSHNAYAGKVRFFSLQWGVVRRPEEPWVLYCDLPGYKGKTWPCKDEADAHARAEAIFARWLQSTGLRADSATEAVSSDDQPS